MIGPYSMLPPRGAFGFPDDVARSLGGPQPSPPRMTGHPGAGPFAELDLTDQLGFDPDRVRDIRCRHLDEGRRGAPASVERAEEPFGLDLAQTTAHATGVLEPV